MFYPLDNNNFLHRSRYGILGLQLNPNPTYEKAIFPYPGNYSVFM